jgi:hypothetical protein
MRSTALSAISLAVAVVAFAALVFLVWINRGGERVPMLFWKAVCGPLLVTIFLLGYDLAKPVEEQNATIPLTLYRAGDNLFANRDLSKDETLPVLPYGYVWLDACYRAWQTVHRKRSDIKSEAERWEVQYQFYQEAAEAAFVMWLASRYPQHWQIQDRVLDGFTGSVGDLARPVTGAQPNQVKLATNDIGKIANNDLVREIGLAAMEQICLPAGSKVSAAPGEYAGRRLSIDTPFTRLDVSFWCMNLPNQIRRESHDPLMRRMANAFGVEDVNGTNVYVDFRATPKRWTRWSGQTELETKWVAAMIEAFRKDFEWRASK